MLSHREDLLDISDKQLVGLFLTSQLHARYSRTQSQQGQLHNGPWCTMIIYPPPHHWFWPLSRFYLPTWPSSATSSLLFNLSLEILIRNTHHILTSWRKEFLSMITYFASLYHFVLHCYLARSHVYYFFLYKTLGFMKVLKGLLQYPQCLA